MSMVPVVHLTKVNIGLDNGLAPNNRQAIVWTKHVLAHWRIYASFGQMIQNCICPKKSAPKICTCNTDNHDVKPVNVYFDENWQETRIILSGCFYQHEPGWSMDSAAEIHSHFSA